MEQRLETLLEEGNAELEAAAEAVGLNTEREARQRAPVETGNLQASLESQTQSRRDVIRIEVGTNVEYAAYQEFLHNPFLRPAVENNMRRSEAELVEAIYTAIKEAGE